jgi:hypothetical protein
LGLLVAVVLGALMALPLAVIASHQFGDVPDSNTYHADIDAIADAGVTTGCGGGNYCPSANVTREQMAAFMNRLGALGPGKVPVVNADKLDGLDSTDFLSAGAVTPGRFVCPGVTMMPESDEADWSENAYAKHFETGSGTFYCHVHLPNGATMTGLYGLFYDASATLQGRCYLTREDTTLGHHSLLALTPWTGAEFAGAVINTTTASISDAVVDNGIYVYFGHCELTGASVNMRLRGIAVTYEVTGLPVW